MLFLEVLKYRNTTYVKRTINLKLARIFRDYLHAFMVHSQKLSEDGTGEGMAITGYRADFLTRKYKLEV